MDWQKLQDRPALKQYGLTLFLVICALAIRLAMYPVIADRAPYMFFFLVVAAVSRLWGPGPGLFATLLGGLATWISSSNHNSHSLSRNNTMSSP
jgi:hypothetical protein